MPIPLCLINTQTRYVSIIHEVFIIKVSCTSHETNQFHYFVFAGGHFVCKLFDVFTVYSVGLMYLMWHAFEQVSIFKPVTSRPANSERCVLNVVFSFLRKHGLKLVLKN